MRASGPLLLFAFLALPVLSGCDASSPPASSTKPPSEPPLLGPDAMKIAGSLDGEAGEIDEYRLALEEGDFVEIEVDQVDVDLFVEFFAPSGELLLHVDSYTGDLGTERLLARAETAGEHRLRLAPLDGDSGEYRLELHPIRPADATDEIRARAASRVAGGDPSPEDLRAALDLYREAGDAWGEADVLDRLGRSLDPRSEEARAVFERAVEAFSLLGETHRVGLVRHQLALSAYLSGDNATARRELLVALGELEDDPYESRQVYNLLGIVRRRTGDAQGAVEAYEKALDLARVLGEERPSSILNNLAVAWQEAGDSRRALEIAREAVAQPVSTTLEGQLLHRIGLLHALLGEGDAALEALDRAYASRLRARDEKGLAATLSTYGLAHREAGRWDEAEAAYRRALEIYERAGDSSARALVLARLARLEIRRGDLEPAGRRLREALDLARRLDEAQLEAGLLLDLAFWHRAVGDLDLAAARAEEALDQVDALRRSMLRLDLLDADSTRRDRRYHEVVDLYMTLDSARPGRGWAARALETSERGRARSLLRLLEASRLARDRGSIEPSFTVEGTAPVLDAASIQSLLDPGVVVLEFDLGTERSWLFRVDRDSVRGHALPGMDVLDASVERAHRLLANAHRAEARRSVDAALCALSRELLASVADDLGATDRPLVVVPDGVLHVVPFAVLPALDAAGECLDRPLLVDRPVVHLPSLSALGSLRRRRADPSRESDPGRWAVIAAPRLETSPHLPFTRREAETLVGHAARAVGRERIDVFLGVEASRPTILDGALAEHRVIHFATHAVIDSEHAERSWLALAERDADGRPIDGKLTVADLFGLDLQAELVTLSACRSALGREIRGEGRVGLARGFFQAGARRLVVSLWDVDDEATAHFMDAFYRRLVEVSSPAEALRAAQLETRADERFAAPSFWAGFVLSGDWRAF